ncbi:nucleoside hydrolase [Floccifex sp.]|uniref:nucleoside hydrolase n=1 Tax=Floccifex sp. TaxID=2815810 RepID=UPI003EFF4945
MKRKIIIDCDPGIDDSLAIMMALSHPDIEVLGITIVAGNCPVEMGFSNAKKILKFMNRLDVPVFSGASQPLKRNYINALDTHGSDGLGESFLEEIEGYEQKEDAISFLSNTLKKEKCSIIAIGPLTNLALLLKKDKEAYDNIEQLISMGGNYKSHGNCSPVAEYNYWCDPDAASLVYNSGKKIHMVGLDVTRKIVLTPKRLDYMKKENPRVGNFVEKITKFYFQFHLEWEHLVGCVINDPLAIAYFIDPSICSGFESFVQIETKSLSIGQSIVDDHNFYRKQANAFICTQVNEEKFFNLFYDCLLRRIK